MTGHCALAASPTGPPAGPSGSSDQADSSGGARPSEATQTSPDSASRWMHSRSLPSAAPSADRMRVRLDDGSADTSRSVRPCSRVSCRRAEASTSWPDSRATTSPGCTSLGATSAISRPCRRTPIRSASRNIWLMSWHASRTVVPCAWTRAISSSTSADSCTPSEAVGSSRSSSRGWCTMARATATSWRWPPDRDRTERSGSCSGTPSCPRMAAASRAHLDVGQQLAAALAAEHHVGGDIKVVAQRQVLPDHRDALALGALRVRRDRPAVQRDHARGRGDVPGDAADQGALARAVLAGQRDELARPHGEIHPVQGGQRAEPDPEPGHRELHGRPRPRGPRPRR